MSSSLDDAIQKMTLSLGESTTASQQDQFLTLLLDSSRMGDFADAQLLHKVLSWMLLGDHGWVLTDYAKEVIGAMHSQLGEVDSTFQESGLDASEINAARVNAILEATKLKARAGHQQGPHGFITDICIYDNISRIRKAIHEHTGKIVGVPKAAEILADQKLVKDRKGKALTKKTICNYWYRINREGPRLTSRHKAVEQMVKSQIKQSET